MRSFFVLFSLVGCGDDAAPGTDAGRIDSGRSDGGVRFDAGRDAAIAVDSGAIDASFDSAVQNPDAGEFDGGTDAGAPDAGEPDAGADAGMVDAAIPDAGPLGLEMLCMDVCAALGACFGMPAPPECMGKCAADLADCSAAQLVEIDACRSRSCMTGPSGLPMIAECIGAVGCVSAGMM